ncbi:MAG: FliG C-terminal domain-containing protein [Treponema sp.]
MTTFEELLFIPDAVLQSLLVDVPIDTIVYALKGASPSMHKKVLQNIIKNAGRECEQRLHTTGTVPIEAVERSQQAILSRCLCKDMRNASTKGDSESGKKYFP